MTTPREVYCHEMGCKHFRGIVGPLDDPVFVCMAYPRGIPEEILGGDDEHKRPRPDDGGYQYEPEAA